MKKNRYVVGYNDKIVWGRRSFACFVGNEQNDWCHPMTLGDARKAQNSMPCNGSKIFKLVPIDEDQP